VRTIFLSSDKNRDITELSTIQLYADRGQALTEDGISASKPIPSTSPPNMFYDGGSAWSHHWSEFIDANNKGAGIMFRNVTNKNLYAFDDMAGNKTGAFEIFTSSQKIEFNPIARYSIDDFQDAYDIAWHGAVVTMGSGLPTETIFPYEVSYFYNEADLYLGLWILVEHPPTVTVT